MKIIFTLLIIFTCVTCNSQTSKNETDFSGFYANEYGEISLKKINNLKTEVSFKNNDGDVFDTIMFADYDFKMIKMSDSLPFLSFDPKAGIELRTECLFVHEFSAGIFLSQFIRIEKMFLRPFYKVGVPVRLKGDINLSKGGATIDGIYLRNYKSEQGYFNVTGIILKERFPIAYYSTKESPQGMFGDTSVAHYRLIMSDYEVTKPTPQHYKGKLLNNAGRAALIWEFADSEVFYFEKKTLWAEEMVGKEVVIEAVLVQERGKGSVLKNWEIVE